MTVLSSAAICIDDGEITIDAEALAPKLGLSTEALRQNMAMGLVMGVTETGENEDAGRTRLTFRYRSRIWRVVIEADGSLFEDPLPGVATRPAKHPLSLFDLAKNMS